MRRAIEAYLAVQQSLQSRNIGPKKVLTRVQRLFELLAEGDKDRLEEGILPSPSSVKRLAQESGFSLDTCVEDLKNFLFWRQHYRYQ